MSFADPTGRTRRPHRYKRRLLTPFGRRLLLAFLTAAVVGAGLAWLINGAS